MFWSAGCSLLRAEGFSYSFDVLYEGRGISKLQYFIKKIYKIFSAVNFLNFWSWKPWIRIRIGIQRKMPDPESMSLELKHC